VAFTDVEERGLALIAAVPTGLPELSLPVLGDVFTLLPAALAIAVMAFLETVLVARTNRKRAEPPDRHRPGAARVGVASPGGSA
jgi:MFS superfamily sulfate permease-like transporter